MIEGLNLFQSVPYEGYTVYLALSLSQLFKGNVRAAAGTREGRPTLKAAGRPTCLPAARKEGTGKGDSSVTAIPFLRQNFVRLRFVFSCGRPPPASLSRVGWTKHEGKEGRKEGLKI